MNLLKRKIRKLGETEWNIAFIEESLNDIIDNKPINIHLMKHNYKNSWFADPFILNVTDRHIVLLVEEYLDSIERGIISRLVVDRKTFELKQKDITLKLPTHLSFPAIYRYNEKIYLYPENYQSGELIIYEYCPETNTCKRIKSLIKKPLTDAIITDLLGEKLMFSTDISNPNGNTLTVYDYNEKKEAYEFKEVVLFNSKTARNAGNWFKNNNKVYRPAQDCNVRYGGSLHLQEVKKREGRFIFKNIRKLEKGHPDYQLALHTFNHNQGITVIDLQKYRRPMLGKIYGCVYRMYKKIP